MMLYILTLCLLLLIVVESAWEAFDAYLNGEWSLLLTLIICGSIAGWMLLHPPRGVHGF